MKIFNLGRKTIHFNKIRNKPESSTDRKPKGYASGHVHKEIEMIFRKKAMVSNEQKLRLDLKLCEHNKRFQLSHPVPAIALLSFASVRRKSDCA